MQFAFWMALVTAVYSYICYPLILGLLPVRACRRNLKALGEPSLSVVITVRNEATNIVEKLDDLFAQEFRGRLEVVVVSDASDDSTDDLVSGYPDERVRLYRQVERRGKEAGQQRGIDEAAFDIIVFTDAATRIGPGSLDALAARFSDEAVGAVSSEDKLLTRDGQIAGEGLYVRYEMALRRLESRFAGLVGLSGSFFAVRKALCEGWRTDVPSDLNVAFLCARAGQPAVSDPGVVGLYRDIKKSSSEYARKRRTIIRGMTGLWQNRDLLGFFRYRGFAWQLWSHKVLRWAVPWALVALLISSAILAPVNIAAAIVLVGQLLFYLVALLGAAVEAARANPFVKIAYFFCQVNLATADALLRFLSGERIVMWEPSKR